MRIIQGENTRIIGLDVGINSVGFSFININESNVNKSEILEMGSRLFEAAEHPKSGASLASPRREARGARRRLARKARKVSRLRTLLNEHGLPAQKIIQLKKGDKSPWQLRKEGLERILSDEEFARALIHFAKRPGFQTNRKSAPPNEETTFTKAGDDLFEAMKAEGVKTIGAWLADQPKQRNDPDSYGRTVIRHHLRAEIKTLFTCQRNFGNKKATERLHDEVIKFAFYRRDLQSSLKLVGKCALYGDENEKRAPKRAFHAELFVALDRLSKCRIISYNGGNRPLAIEEIARLEQGVLTSSKLTFAQARQALNLHEDETFNLASYTFKLGETLTQAQIRQRAEKPVFVEMKGFHTLRVALEKISKMDWAALASRHDDLDQIAFALSFFESEDEIRSKLKPLNLPENQIIALLGATGFSQTINISLKAAKEIIPYLRRGETYTKAVLNIRPDHQTRTGEQALLPPLPESTRNPIVDRSLSQIRKVVNALVRKHGMPDHFHVETARDLGRNSNERKSIEDDNRKRQAFKEETRKHAAEIYGFEPSGDELARFRLWKEQSMRCPYSGQEITPQHLQNGTDTQIDHILPYSRSYDDSWSNKVLCFSRENQAKENQTAWEYMERNNMTRELEVFARGQQNQYRCSKLLKQNFDEEQENGWKSRHLNDTRYIARALTAYLEDNLKPNPGINKLVHTRKGGLTSKLRHLWGLPKDRENDHRHHGVDALVIACATDDMVRKVARWSRYQRGKRNDPGFYADAPWGNFRRDALAKLDEMFVTRQPSRKTGGRLHKDTIMSLRFDDQGSWQAVKRVPVKELKKSDLENLVDVEIVDGQPRGRNATLYRVLNDRLAEFDNKPDNKPDKAFAQPVFMPLKPGKTGPNGELHGPEIRRVRVFDNTKAGFRLKNHGFANNAEMAWTEVYEKDGKFYLLPIYTWQVATKEWPQGLITANKSEDGWDKLEEGHNFLFSLFKNDFLILENKKGIKEEGYFKRTDRATGTITFEEHKGETKYRFGVKTMKSFRKYHIDLFGNRSEVKESAPWRGEP